MKQIFKRSFKRKLQSGQAMLEYIILTATIGVFCLVTMKQLGEHIKRRVESINKKVVKNIEL